jgi:hypothetical protein
LPPPLLPLPVLEAATPPVLRFVCLAGSFDDVPDPVAEVGPLVFDEPLPPLVDGAAVGEGEPVWEAVGESRENWVNDGRDLWGDEFPYLLRLAVRLERRDWEAIDPMIVRQMLSSTNTKEQRPTGRWIGLAS